MFYLIYISTAVELMKQDDLLSILDDSRRNNLRDEITGVLLYSEGIFMQALEGDEELVMALYKKIEKDQMHKNMIMLISGETEQRAFPDWSMAFITLDHSQMDEIKGYINPFNKDLFKGDASTPAISILKTFAESNHLAISNHHSIT
jgi:hypothetical protein